jgi:hypothetical protein
MITRTLALSAAALAGANEVGTLRPPRPCARSRSIRCLERGFCLVHRCPERSGFHLPHEFSVIPF